MFARPHVLARRLDHVYVSCIVQVLVLSHEDATRTEQLPYLRVRLRPMQVLDFFGRAANRDPPCHTHHCVWYWWKEPVGKERRWGNLGNQRERGNSNHQYRKQDMFVIANEKPFLTLTILVLLQDVALPFMLDARFPEDQLFFVAESDFRFYEQDCVKGQDWIEAIRQAMATYEAPGPETNASSHKHPPGPPEGPRLDTGANRPVSKAHVSGDASARDEWAKRKKPPPPPPPVLDGFEASSKPLTPTCNPSQELKDLVRVVTQAARIGRGDLVWHSWVGSGKKKARPCHGTTLVSVTPTAARALLDRMTLGTAQPQHFDVWLRDQLVHEQAVAERMGACYVWPSIGGFDEHVSGCDPKQLASTGGVRESDWNKSWSQEGVRPTCRQHNQRWLCPFQASGVTWLQQLSFREEAQLAWKTQSCPRVWWDRDLQWQFVLERRGWIYENKWWGPETEDNARKNKRRSCSGDWSDPRSRSPEHRLWNQRRTTWDVLRDNPDEWNWDYERKGWLLISALAEQVVVDRPDYDPCLETSKRAKNTRKRQLAQYKFRIFAGETEQATPKI